HCAQLPVRGDQQARRRQPRRSCTPGARARMVVGGSAGRRLLEIRSDPRTNSLAQLPRDVGLLEQLEEAFLRGDPAPRELAGEHEVLVTEGCVLGYCEIVGIQ